MLILALSTHVHLANSGFRYTSLPRELKCPDKKPVVAEIAFHYAAQAGLRLLDSGNAPSSDFLRS